GRRGPVIDFLGPAFQRKLDGERLVDGECDVEKVEAVDPEIVDRVALRLDVLARDVTRFRNDAGHSVERRGHRQFSETLEVSAAAGTVNAPSLPSRGASARPREPRCPYSEADRGVQWRVCRPVRHRSLTVPRANLAPGTHRLPRSSSRRRPGLPPATGAAADRVRRRARAN